MPLKKDNLSVYNKRKVYFASLLSFLKKQGTLPTKATMKISTPQFPKVYREILRNNCNIAT